MIFPIPVKEDYNEGYYVLKEVKKSGDLLGFYRNVKDGNVDISYKNSPDYREEEYQISVESAGVEIKCASEIGKFRALTTLNQMIEEGKLPFGTVYDYPQFERRGYMLDISRCRMPKLETITWLIDLLVGLKYNELQLYMDGFVYKYEAFPEYTKDFDCLTAEDIEYLDKYCAERFIDLVPNQNCFGHMEKWLEKPELKHLGLTDGIVPADSLNPLLDESLQLVDQILGSLLPHFSSKYVNIGFDEVSGLGKFQTEEACKKQGYVNVFMDYLNKVANLCQKKYGKTVMFWSDMLTKYPESYSQLPENAIALNWGYDMIQAQMMTSSCRDFKNAKIPYYVCPGNCAWVSFTGRFDVMNFDTRTLGEIGREYGAKGYLMTDWGSYEGHMQFLVWSLVPAALAGQYAWNVGVAQEGWILKNEFVYAAEDYIDQVVFGAKVSRLLYRMQQYYLLEPERIHNSTMCCLMFKEKLTKTQVRYSFDLMKCGSDFYFDNVIEYMKKCLEELEKVEFDERLKREIKVNAHMVIVASELMKIRMSQSVNAEMCEDLCNYMDEIAKEYQELWTFRNYEKGKENFLGQLNDRKQDLKEFLKREIDALH